MIIKTVKDLEKLIKLCKKQGIPAIKVGNIEFTLPQSANTKPAIDPEVFPEANIKVPAYNGVKTSLEPDAIKTEELTEEQLMFYSAKEEPGTEDSPQ